MNESKLIAKLDKMVDKAMDATTKFMKLRDEMIEMSNAWRDNTKPKLQAMVRDRNATAKDLTDAARASNKEIEELERFMEKVKKAKKKAEVLASAYRAEKKRVEKELKAEAKKAKGK